MEDGGHKTAKSKLDDQSHPASVVKTIQGKRKKEKKYPCSSCSAAFSRENDLKSREQRKHQGEKRFPCNACGAAFTKIAKLRIHEKLKHHGKASVSQVKKKPCPYCDIFFDREEISLHLMDVHWNILKKEGFCSEDPLPPIWSETGSCMICHGVLSNQKEFCHHLDTHIANTRFGCLWCDSTFTDIELLKSHTDSRTCCRYDNIPDNDHVLLENLDLPFENEGYMPPLLIESPGSSGNPPNHDLESAKKYGAFKAGLKSPKPEEKLKVRIPRNPMIDTIWKTKLENKVSKPLGNGVVVNTPRKIPIGLSMPIIPQTTKSTPDLRFKNRVQGFESSRKLENAPKDNILNIVRMPHPSSSKPTDGETQGKLKKPFVKHSKSPKIDKLCKSKIEINDCGEGAPTKGASWDKVPREVINLIPGLAGIGQLPQKRIRKHVNYQEGRNFEQNLCTGRMPVKRIRKCVDYREDSDFEDSLCIGAVSVSVNGHSNFDEVQKRGRSSVAPDRGTHKNGQQFAVKLNMLRVRESGLSAKIEVKLIGNSSKYDQCKTSFVKKAGVGSKCWAVGSSPCSDAPGSSVTAVENTKLADRSSELEPIQQANQSGMAKEKASGKKNNEIPTDGASAAEEISEKNAADVSCSSQDSSMSDVVGPGPCEVADELSECPANPEFDDRNLPRGYKSFSSVGRKNEETNSSLNRQSSQPDYPVSFSQDKAILNVPVLGEPNIDDDGTHEIDWGSSDGDRGFGSDDIDSNLLAFLQWRSLSPSNYGATTSSSGADSAKFSTEVPKGSGWGTSSTASCLDNHDCRFEAGPSRRSNGVYVPDNKGKRTGLPRFPSHQFSWDTDDEL